MPVYNGTSSVTGTPMQFVRPPDIVSVAGGNYVPPSTGPVGPSGWPVGVPPPAGPVGTVGWATGLPEQARGTTGQATITGVAGPMVVPQHPPNIQVDPVPPDVVGQAVEVPVPVLEPADAAAGAGVKTKAPLELRQYDGTGSLETYLAEYEHIAAHLDWKEADRFYHLCAALDGAAGRILWDLKEGATSKFVIDLLQTRFGDDVQVERWPKCNKVCLADAERTRIEQQFQ